jgi:hypothetical protein
LADVVVAATLYFIPSCDRDTPPPVADLLLLLLLLFDDDDDITGDVSVAVVDDMEAAASPAVALACSIKVMKPENMIDFFKVYHVSRSNLYW